MSPKCKAVFEGGEDALTATLRRVLCEVLPDAPELAKLRGTVRKLVAGAARWATIAVAGAAGHTAWSLSRDVIEAVLFDANAPLLLPERSAPLTDRVVALARERSAAVEAALPPLLAAERVVVLVPEEGHHRASLPEDLLAVLREHGKRAEIKRFALGGRDVGEAILDGATSAHADLLVMGAFTHARLLKSLFGGATREILDGARIPLLLHH